MTVWKFVLRRAELQDVEMPVGAKVLHVAMQGHDITLWAWVDPDAKVESRRFAITGSGAPAPTPDQARYHGTVIDGAFVWHVFERVS